MHLSEIWHSKKNDCRLSRTQVIADTMQTCKPMTVKTSKYAVDSYKVNAKHEIRKSRLASHVARLATTISNPENKIIAIEALLSREAKKIGAKRDAYSTMKE